MSEAHAGGAPDSAPPPGIDFSATLAALRARGAQRLDPVRFQVIEAMARRAAAHERDVRRWLDHKLAGLLAACDDRLEQAHAEAGGLGQRLAAEFPGAADELRRRQADGDLAGLRQLAATLPERRRGAPLADLVLELDRRAAEDGPAKSASDGVAVLGQPAELRALRDFRSTWSQLRIDQQMSRSLAQAPDNAGPLNSHLLVLRSLQAMRDIAPAYLHRFVSYVDALMWLDQAELPRPRAAKATPADAPARRAKR